MRSLKEQHCCADWETLLTFNLSCFKNQFCTLDVRQKQTALSCSKGQAGRNYWPISWSAHAHNPALFSFCSLPSWRNHKPAPQRFALLTFGVIQNGLLSHDFARCKGHRFVRESAPRVSPAVPCLCVSKQLFGFLRKPADGPLPSLTLRKI